MSGDNTPRDQMERDFLDIVREGRRRVFEGPGAAIPLSKRRLVLSLITIDNTETGEPVGTLADSDEQILRAFRRTLKGH